jgi:hypothetical protein
MNSTTPETVGSSYGSWLNTEFISSSSSSKMVTSIAYIYSITNFRGVCAAENQFVKFVAHFIEWHGLRGLAAMLMLGEPRDSLRNGLPVDMAVFVEALNVGFERGGFTTTRCDRSTLHCSCKSVLDDLTNCNKDEKRGVIRKRSSCRVTGDGCGKRPRKTAETYGVN